MTITEMILGVLNYEESEEAKLDILTDIGLGTTNEEIFKATEEAREAIVSVCIRSEKVQVRKEKILQSNGCTEQVYQVDNPKGCDENNGDA